ncbi:MAG: sigma-54-dependent Fis family transcriptional regulator [Myxococcales bacterium]|nr:sigma-54-dependent Fis family transcriptional regulator [Myxococcales bacterium]
MRHVLVVDDEEGLRHMLVVLLTREGYQATAVGSGEAALRELDHKPYDVVLSDIRMPRFDGLQLVDEIRRRGLRMTVIMMSAFGTLDTALEAMKRGAYDYIAKPFKPDEVVLVLRKAEERERLFRENQSLKRALAARASPNGLRGIDQILGQSKGMQEIARTIRKIAEYKTTVLVTGESGTGKEMVARALHACSPRAKDPFVAVNCAAIPEALLESELFGHRKGAFTDAHRDKRGLFEEASGGTLFLDEIGDLPVALQVKLLRVLQEQEIRPVGAVSDVKIDVRVIAATARDLPGEVKEGRFREDLYYRLNVLQIHLPPLRDRKEDIPALLEHFIAKINTRLGTRIGGTSTDALQLLIDHAWPGNVRELENTVERAMVLSDGNRIDAEVLPDKVRESRDKIRLTLLSGELSIKKTTRVIEEELIRKALRETRGNRTNAAKLLEISHRALLYKIKEFGIESAGKI